MPNIDNRNPVTAHVVAIEPQQTPPTVTSQGTHDTIGEEALDQATISGYRSDLTAPGATLQIVAFRKLADCCQVQATDMSIALESNNQELQMLALEYLEQLFSRQRKYIPPDKEMLATLASLLDSKDADIRSRSANIIFCSLPSYDQEISAGNILIQYIRSNPELKSEFLRIKNNPSINPFKHPDRMRPLELLINIGIASFLSGKILNFFNSSDTQSGFVLLGTFACSIIATSATMAFLSSQNQLQFILRSATLNDPKKMYNRVCKELGLSASKTKLKSYLRDTTRQAAYKSILTSTLCGVLGFALLQGALATSWIFSEPGPAKFLGSFAIGYTLLFMEIVGISLLVAKYRSLRNKNRGST